MRESICSLTEPKTQVIATEAQLKLSLRGQCQRLIGHMAQVTLPGVLLVFSILNACLKKCLKLPYTAPSYINLAKFGIHVKIYFLYDCCQLIHITT